MYISEWFYQFKRWQSPLDIYGRSGHLKQQDDLLYLPRNEKSHTVSDDEARLKMVERKKRTTQHSDISSCNNIIRMLHRLPQVLFLKPMENISQFSGTKNNDYHSCINSITKC